MHIGKRIQRLMRAKDISTQAMAAYCGVTAGAVSNWFSTGRISKENLAKAAARLGTDMEALMSEDDRPEAGNSPSGQLGLSPQALALAMLFDQITDRKDRAAAWGAAIAAINEVLSARGSAQPSPPSPAEIAQRSRS